jgi:hypothetical protein
MKSVDGLWHSLYFHTCVKFSRHRVKITPKPSLEPSHLHQFIGVFKNHSHGIADAYHLFVRLNRTKSAMKTISWVMLGALVMSFNAQAQTPVRVNPAAVPMNQPFAFYLLSMANGANSGPPLPFDPWPGEPLYSIGEGNYVIDDRTVAAAKAALQQMTMEEDEEGPPSPPGGGSTNGGSGSLSPLDRSYLTNGMLWIEITSIDTNNNLIYLRLHNTTNTMEYQIWSKANLTDTNWSWGEFDNGQNGYLDFGGVPMTTPDMFFRGVGSSNVVDIGYANYQTGTTKPCSTNDSAEPVELQSDRYASSFSSSLNVQWKLSGSAIYGKDYIITNVSTGSFVTNSVTFPANAGQEILAVVPLYNTNFTFDTGVILTLVQTNGYLISTNLAWLGVSIGQCYSSNLFTVVTNGLDAPTGIDYNPVANALIVSINGGYGGYPNNFIRLGTNSAGALTLTNWSGVSGVGNEVKLATVKTTTNNFVKGDMYFGSDTMVGKLSADGTVSNKTWCVLTNATYTNDVGLRGGLYIDQSGSFGGDLIAVTGDDEPDAPGSLMGVWRIHVDTNGSPHPALLASIPTEHLEGVITLPNDANRFGPWAGKILTGDEDEDVLYTIDTNGTVTPYDATTIFPTGIGSEDFDLIPTNQDLYVCAPASDDPNGNQGIIYKLPHAMFNPYVGDLLITQSGDSYFRYDGFANPPPELFIVHWDATNAVFNARGIPLSVSGMEFEHVTFAPINLPSQPVQ